MFQFNRTHNQVFNRFASKTLSGSIKVGGRIQIYDVIGKQALKYWIDRDVKFDYVLQNTEFAKVHKISLTELHSLVEKKELRLKTTLQSEEIEKARFLNTTRGLLNCIQYTTLYNHHSLNCIRCLNKVDCKKMLKSNYLQIYVERGYGTPSYK